MENQRNNGTSLLELTINKAKGIYNKVKGAGRQIKDSLVVRYCDNYDDSSDRCMLTGQICRNPESYNNCQPYMFNKKASRQQIPSISE